MENGMVKGCQKNMILLRDTGSDLIEEAYFILRHESTARRKVGDADLAREAARIIRENWIPNAPSEVTEAENRKGRNGRRMRAVWFLSGTGIGAALCAAVLALCGVL